MEIATYRPKEDFVDKNSSICKVKEIKPVERKEEMIGKPGEFKTYMTKKIILDDESETTLSELYQNGFRLITIQSGIFFLERG